MKTQHSVPPLFSAYQANAYISAGMALLLCLKELYN